MTPTRSINISDLRIGHRSRPLGIQSLEDLPVILLPALIAGDTIGVEDTLQRLGVGGVSSVFDEVAAVLCGLGAVGGVVVGRVVGLVAGVVPADA